MTFLKNSQRRVSYFSDPKYFIPTSFISDLANEKEDENDQHDVNVWEDNWDDDAVEDDFSVQLR